jgi:Uma2 family endonuclease
MGHQSELALKKLSGEELVRRYLGLAADPRFTDFAGKIEINEFGDLLLNAASRGHVLLQKRFGVFLERTLGGEAITEMAVRIALPGGAGYKLRVPDISWSSDEGFFEGPEELAVLPAPAELCVGIKSDSSTVIELEEKARELLAAGAREVWLVFPSHQRVQFYSIEGRSAQTTYPVDVAQFWANP